MRVFLLFFLWKTSLHQSFARVVTAVMFVFSVFDCNFRIFRIFSQCSESNNQSNFIESETEDFQKTGNKTSQAWQGSSSNLEGLYSSWQVSTFFRYLSRNCEIAASAILNFTSSRVARENYSNLRTEIG